MNNARRISPPMRSVWLGEGRDRGERKAECCAKCRRGVKGYGELPCGYSLRCPNPKCAHAEHPTPKTFDHLNTKESD